MLTEQNKVDGSFSMYVIDKDGVKQPINAYQVGKNKSEWSLRAYTRLPATGTAKKEAEEGRPMSVFFEKV
jgi:hypothetical protein